jgi:predicted CXXCH cytochrome family protein
MCHSYEGLSGVTANGDTVSLFVDGEHMRTSVHGKADLRCSSCHADMSAYPHGDKGQVGCSQCHAPRGLKEQPLLANLPYESARALSIALNDACRRCHEEQFTGTQDGTHMEAFTSGNDQAPLCTDCHGSHDVARPDQPRTHQVEICAECHQAVYTSYRASLHGTALYEEGNTDVPTCVNCHGVHNVQGPRDAAFRDESITTCGSCHADQALMARYGISADVFQTYLDDFHGRTVNLNRQESSPLPSDQAVCYDCHGVHNILPPTDPDSTVNHANLKATCGQCHADANERFPDAWLGHKNPSFTSTPALYGVSIFYKILIPATLGFFGLYIVLDVRKRRSERRAANRRVGAEALQEQPATAPQEPPVAQPPEETPEDEAKEDLNDGH